MALPARRAKRIDANQPEIVQALRKAGVVVQIVSEPCDLLCGHAGRFVTLEVKDGRKCPSKRRLTEAEQEYYDLCKSAGLPHYVVESVEQAYEAMGLIR